jgi:hypothetical protein
MLHRFSSQVAGHLFRNRANEGSQARTLTCTAEAGTSNLCYGSSCAPLSDSRGLITSRGSANGFARAFIAAAVAGRHSCWHCGVRIPARKDRTYSRAGQKQSAIYPITRQRPATKPRQIHCQRQMAHTSVTEGQAQKRLWSAEEETCLTLLESRCCGLCYPRRGTIHRHGPLLMLQYSSILFLIGTGRSRSSVQRQAAPELVHSIRVSNRRLGVVMLTSREFSPTAQLSSRIDARPAVQESTPAVS